MAAVSISHCLSVRLPSSSTIQAVTKRAVSLMIETEYVRTVPVCSLAVMRS
jgi:hypothetical protein